MIQSRVGEGQRIDQTHPGWAQLICKKSNAIKQIHKKSECRSMK